MPKLTEPATRHDVFDAMLVSSLMEIMGKKNRRQFAEVMDRRFREICARPDEGRFVRVAFDPKTPSSNAERAKAYSLFRAIVAAFEGAGG